MSGPARGAQSDAALVASCRAGADGAWRELVGRYSDYVYAILIQAYRLAESDAEDVFQDVFARAHERLDTLRDPSALRPWIAQLTRRLAVDRLRAGAREQPTDPVPVAEDATDEAISRLDDALTVRQALAELPGACQEILGRFFAEDQSYQTIAAALGLPPGTIASRISRCLRRLREALEGRTEASPPSSDQG